MKTVGIDPGKKGCIVTLDTDTHECHFIDMPWRDDGVLDLRQLNAKLSPYWSGMIYLEKVQGRVGWGATQTFNFGVNYGQLLAWLYDKPHTLVLPKKWQYIAHLGTREGNPKAKSYEGFVRLNPSSDIKKKHDGLIDAFHIARFGLLFGGASFKDDWQFIEL